jgi:hypothetical protein
MQDDFPTKDFFNFNFYQLANSIQPNQTKPNNKITLLTLPFQNEQEKLFLSKILQAINITDFNQLFLLELSPEMPFSWADFYQQTNTNIFIVFGRTGLALGWQFEMPLYQSITYQNQQFLFAENLLIVQADNHKKRLLWEALKALKL